MHNFISYIQQHLSLRLGLLILVVVSGVFGISFSLLFLQINKYVRQAAERQAMEVLDQTISNISNIMDHAEMVTADMERLVQQNLQPDSLLAYTRRMLEQNPEIMGFTIAMEPDFFPSEGHNFSAYSLRQRDSITTVIEKHDYFSQVWYREPWRHKKALWLEPYIDDTPGILTSSEYNYSFVKPLYTTDGRPIGILCTDLLLKWLSQTVTEVKPFPHSSAIMIGHDGKYIVHPDTTKLVRQTIFSDPSPESRQQIIPLGQSMIAGQTGAWALVVDGQPAHLFYRPLERTGWSIAIVCPDSDVFSSYNRLLNIALAVIVLFLLVLLLFCYLTIRRTIIPVNQLAEAARQLSSTLPDITTTTLLERSNRVDTVGQLQNSFMQMQQAIQSSIANLKAINAETEKRNEELQRAYQLVREADARKTTFIQDMYHEIRTPLNIINGFTQVIALSYPNLPADELADITARMRTSARDITNITHKLSESALSVSPYEGDPSTHTSDHSINSQLSK